MEDCHPRGRFLECVAELRQLEMEPSRMDPKSRFILEFGLLESYFFSSQCKIYGVR